MSSVIAVCERCCYGNGHKGWLQMWQAMLQQPRNHLGLPHIKSRKVRSFFQDIASKVWSQTAFQPTRVLALSNCKFEPMNFFFVKLWTLVNHWMALLAFLKDVNLWPGHMSNMCIAHITSATKGLWPDNSKFGGTTFTSHHLDLRCFKISVHSSCQRVDFRLWMHRSSE